MNKYALPRVKCTIMVQVSPEIKQHLIEVSNGSISRYVRELIIKDSEKDLKNETSSLEK